MQGDPPWPSDAISIESNGISNRSNRNSQKLINGRKFARMARIVTIFGQNRSSRRNLSFQNFSNERKIIESIESIDWINGSTDRSDRSKEAMKPMRTQLPMRNAGRRILFNTLPSEVKKKHYNYYRDESVLMMMRPKNYMKSS